MPDNLLYYGDNLDIFRRYVKGESIDLVYLAPLKSHQDYTMLFAGRDGFRSVVDWIAACDTVWMTQEFWNSPDQDRQSRQRVVVPETSMGGN